MAKNKKISFSDALAVCDELNFASSEAYKILRTNIQYGFTDNDGCKVIGITSSERNEGKSTIAVNLAYMLSCDKKRVLLLDGDMRLPSISKKLSIESTPGLSEYLTGKITGNEGIQKSEKAPELSVICAGVVPPNPSELLGSVSMEKFLSVLKKVFDYIIVDLPPVNIVSDPLSIAKYLDGFVVVARSEYTTRQGVKDVVQKLRLVDAKILGFVINGDSGSSEMKYGKYSRYSKYGRYGKYAKYGRYGYYGYYGYRDKAYEKSYEDAVNAQVGDPAPADTESAKK